MPNPLDDRQVYTLADLSQWEKLRPGLPPSLAVLGHPVAHSVSPQMHNAALAELAKKHSELKDWRYFKFDIKPEELKEALEMLLVKNFQGVNLTIPHKVAAFKIVTDINDEVREVGAMNTLVRSSLKPFWSGNSTDSFGLQTALRNDLEVNLAGTSVVILGAGGAARSAAFQCLYDKSSALWIGNRTQANLNQLLQHLKSHNLKTQLNGFDLASPPAKEWPEDVVVINTTPLGLNAYDPSPINVILLGEKAKVFDTIYRPTNLVASAVSRGLCATDGLGMLVWQGASSLSIWASRPSANVFVKVDEIAQTMMDAACVALGFFPRHA
jgi:shikimate dehydrogenase